MAASAISTNTYLGAVAARGSTALCISVASYQPATGAANERQPRYRIEAVVLLKVAARTTTFRLLGSMMLATVLFAIKASLYSYR
jgi:hypothetical protein